MLSNFNMFEGAGGFIGRVSAQECATIPWPIRSRNSILLSLPFDHTPAFMTCQANELNN